MSKRAAGEAAPKRTRRPKRTTEQRESDAYVRLLLDAQNVPSPRQLRNPKVASFVELELASIWADFVALAVEKVAEAQPDQLPETLQALATMQTGGLDWALVALLDDAGRTWLERMEANVRSK